MKKYGLLVLVYLFTSPLFAEKVVNVYVWGGEIPKTIIRQFESETGIKVNFSTYDSNETLYAKLKISRQTVYDVILPSAYYVERMHKQGMLTPLDKTKLPNLKHLDPLFTHGAYDPENHYSVPIIWGATGIFYNAHWVKEPPTTWKALWQARWRHQLLLLDDPREIFAMALLSLGYEPNDRHPEHIKEAYQTLLQLIANIKLFASDSIQAIMIDEDAIAGAVWNGDAFKAHAENSQINFIYPKEGFVLWVDCLAIPEGAPHLEEAYQFVNFILKPQSAKEIALREGHAITNQAGKALLPETIQNNPMVYPSQNILKRGHFQSDVGDETIALYNHYWEKLKLAF